MTRFEYRAIDFSFKYKTDFVSSKTKLSWNFKGSCKLQKGNDSLMLTMDMVKTLENTSVTAVFDPSRTKSIVWAKAIVSYSGKITGYTSGNKKFTMTISPEEAIIRDFTCSPSVVSNVSSTGSSTLVTNSSEYHPFINGIATFTTEAKYPRRIYYGGSETVTTPSCDNSGAILIKGISYPVDFRVD